MLKVLYLANYAPNFDSQVIEGTQPLYHEEIFNQLVDLGETSWLSEVAAARDAARQGLPGVPPKLHHLLVYFSDHASYEFICAGYRVSDKTAQAS